MPSVYAPGRVPGAAGAFTPADALAVAYIRHTAALLPSLAASGHPGAPLGLAPAAHVLWTRFLRAHPDWPARDRFVLSCGHASALLYTMLYLSGTAGLGLNDLSVFRQLGSVTPGHPESHLTPGVEVTTGPLGQGFASAVGLAVAQARADAAFGAGLFKHHTYVFCSDGDLMEGISGEAAALAGHWSLGRLVVLWDDNHVTIDGGTELSFTVDVRAQFRAYGWQVLEVADGDTDLAGIARAIAAARAETARPSLVCVRTTIGYGTRVAGTSGAHGTPLGTVDLDALAQPLGTTQGRVLAAPPEPVAQIYAQCKHDILQRMVAWREHLTQCLVAAGAVQYIPGSGEGQAGELGPGGPGELGPGGPGEPEDTSDAPDGPGAPDASPGASGMPAAPCQTRPDRTQLPGPLIAELPRIMARALPEAWVDCLPVVDAAGVYAHPLATRKVSGHVLDALAAHLPELVGGAADLATSTCTTLCNAPDFTAACPLGRVLRFGVREHAQHAIANGIAYYGLGSVPFAATFLVFTVSYALAAVRMAAMARLGVLVIATHDSIGLGEDGPTHQPVGALAALRALPGLCVFRPADAREVVGTYRTVLPALRGGPALLCLSRQNCPLLAHSREDAVARGAYVVWSTHAGDLAGDAGGDAAHAPALVLVATGSEVGITVTAAEQLAAEPAPVSVRVVSMPSQERFLEQSAAYRRRVFPRGVPALSVEAASSFGWGRFAQAHVAIDTFGASGPGPQVLKHFGFTPANIVSVAHGLLADS